MERDEQLKETRETDNMVDDGGEGHIQENHSKIVQGERMKIVKKKKTQIKLLTWNIAANQLDTSYNLAKGFAHEIEGYAFLETWREDEIKWRPNEVMSLFQISATRIHMK